MDFVVFRLVLSRKHIGFVNHMAQFNFIFAERSVEIIRDFDIIVAFEETITPTPHRSDVVGVCCLGRCAML